MGIYFGDSGRCAQELPPAEPSAPTAESNEANEADEAEEVEKSTGSGRVKSSGNSEALRCMFYMCWS